MTSTRNRHRMPAFRPRLALAAAFALLGSGLCLAGLSQPVSPEDVRQERAKNRLKDSRPAQERQAGSPRELPPVDAGLVGWYRATMTELSDPAYEGRSPGSEGIEKAAGLIEAHFAELGLTPAFPKAVTSADGIGVRDPFQAWRQGFSVGQEVRATTTEMSVDGVPLDHGIDFSVLAYSGDADVTAPVAFAGYAIVTGASAFLGFAPNARFDGQIVLCLDKEPMDDQGNSLWRDDGFTHHSRMPNKASALIRRGAAAVLIVTPPATNDERAGILETVDSTRVTRGGLGAKAPKFDAPVIHITPDIAQRILDRSGDPELTLGSLVERSNRGAIDLDIPGGAISLNVEMETIDRVAFNVAGILPGRGDLADEYVVIGAHYDHVGYGLRGTARENAQGSLHPGADDNASGSAGVLLLADILSEMTAQSEGDRRSLLLMLFDGEESGLHGARHYVNDPIADAGSHAVMLNWDMIGRIEDERLVVAGLDTGVGMRDFFTPMFEGSGLDVRAPERMSGASDHTVFYRAGIPVIFSHIDGLHSDYHTPEDTSDKINRVGATKAVRLYAEMVAAYATYPERFGFYQQESSQAPSPMSSIKVRFGIMPGSYSEDEPGIPVGDVTPGSAAAEGGVLAGDRLVRWDGQKLTDMQSWMQLLAQHEPGDEVRVGVIRDGEEITLGVTLKGR